MRRWTAQALMALLLLVLHAGHLTLGVGRAVADADNPTDWSTLTATRVVFDVLWARNQLVGAVDPGGLLFYDPASQVFTPFTTDDGLGSNRAQCLALNDADEIWVGSADAGITRILPDGRTRRITALPDQLDVRAIAFDGDDAYYGGPDGAGRIISGLPERTFTTENGLVSDNVRAVAARSGKAWFATDQGIGEFDIQRNDVVTLNDGLANLDVRAITLAGGLVYAGTASGVYVLDESIPTAPVWNLVAPALPAEIVDLAGSPSRLAVLGTGNRVWWRDDPADPWTFQVPAAADERFYAITLDASDVVRLSGRRFDAAPIGNDVTPLFSDLTEAASPPYRRIYGTQFFGLEPDDAGGVWVGAFPVDGALTHWRADGSIIAYTAPETGDPDGVLNHDGWIENLKIDIHQTTDGALWVSNFQKGVTRFVPGPDTDPDASSWAHYLSLNSPLNIDRVWSMEEDPHGNLWFCAAGEEVTGDYNSGIDILTDPDNPLDPGSWIHLRRSSSELAGDGLYRISFEGDRTVWLTVRGVGIQRFVYGDGTGVDPARFNDPYAWRTITALPEFQSNNLGAAREVAVSPAGRIWVATDGKGLFSFKYLPHSGEAGEDGEVLSTKAYGVDAIGARILSDNVYSVDIRDDGTAWAATALGLSRVVEGAEGSITDSYTDLQTLLDFNLGNSISQRALRSLAGGTPVRLELSPSDPLLFMVSARGVTRVDLRGTSSGGEGGEGPSFGLYPNPVRGDDDLVVDDFEGEATVEIYDLQGRPLRRTTAQPGDAVWRLETLSGAPVANGLYMVRLTQNGQSSIRILAVER